MAPRKKLEKKEEIPSLKSWMIFLERWRHLLEPCIAKKG
jgi:hypothetical protein